MRVSLKKRRIRDGPPRGGAPFPVHAEGLFEDTVNRATRSGEGAVQGEQ